MIFSGWSRPEAPFRLHPVFAATALVVLAATGAAQQTGSKASETEQAATLAKAITVRDAFIAHVRSAGFTCPIAAPTVVVEDIPSFGQYQSSTNTLHTSDWNLLRPAEKAFFLQLAGPHADDDAAHAVFEKAAHGWIFVHEMGHWWQACRDFTADHSHFQVEYEANRIALAYWRDTDPGIATLMMSLFHGVLDHMPSPVPPGQTVEEYFNKNYETLGPSPAYPWFQSRMGVTLEQERPAPTWTEVLASTKK